jgi:hypothetical protein
MATRKTKRRTQTQPTQSHGPRIRKPIVKIINELKSWLPNYDHGPNDYPTILLRLLAALPGGEELEDAGYEPLGGASIGWHEADQLGRVLEAIQDKQDVEDIARELLSDNPEDLEERGPPIAREDRPRVGRNGACTVCGREGLLINGKCSLHRDGRSPSYESGEEAGIVDGKEWRRENPHARVDVRDPGLRESALQAWRQVGMQYGRDEYVEGYVQGFALAAHTRHDHGPNDPGASKHSRPRHRATPLRRRGR